MTKSSLQLIQYIPVALNHSLAHKEDTNQVDSLPEAENEAEDRDNQLEEKDQYEQLWALEYASSHSRANHITKRPRIRQTGRDSPPLSTHGECWTLSSKGFTSKRIQEVQQLHASAETRLK